MGNRRPNHHRTGIIGQDYPIDPYRPDLHKAFDPYDRDWRTGNPAGNGPSRFTDEVGAWGLTPNNEDADYFGVYVRMTREKFLRLAAPLPEAKKNSAVAAHMAAGGKVATPILYVKIPSAWQKGDFSHLAEVTGHEGRNRMTAIPPGTVENVLIIPRSIPEMRARHMTPQILGEIHRRLYTENDDLSVPKRMELDNFAFNGGRTGNPAKLTDEQYAAWEQAVSDAKDARDHRDSSVAQRRGYAAAHAAAAQHKSHAEAYYAARQAYSKAADYAGGGRTGNPDDSGGFLWEFEGEPTTLQAMLEANPPGEPSNRLVRAAIAHFMRAAQKPAFQRGAVLFGGGAGADLVFSVRRAGAPAWSYDEQEEAAMYIEALIEADPSLLTARRPHR